MPYRLLADIVVAVHVGYVACVVFGLVLILLGRALGWKWTNNRWFRSVHLAMIAVVVFRSFIWANSPLTTWEDELRVLAGQVDEDGYVNFEGAPVGHALHAIIHPPLPLWVFPIIYSIFGLLVLSTFWFAPVDWRGHEPGTQ
jgi:hypothetical protein